MGSAWAIACESAEGETARVELGEFGPGRKPTVSQGDTVVLFRRDVSDVTYWAMGSIVGALEDVDKAERRLVFSLVEVSQRFDRPRSLEELRFSLAHVFRFSEPLRHYQRPYRSLSEEDVRTIESGRVFGARTALGLLADVLPMSERLEFASRWIERRRRTYQEIANDLLRYVRERYGSTAELLNEIRNRSDSLNLGGDSITGLVLVDEEGEEFDVRRLAQDAETVVAILSGTGESVFDRLVAMDEPEPSFRPLGRHLRLTENEAFLRILGIAR